MKFLSRETFKIGIQYMAVAVASMPAGVVYALLLRANYTERTALMYAIPLGLILGFVGMWLVRKLPLFR